MASSLKEKAERLRAEGASYRSVAAAVGRSVSTVSRWVDSDYKVKSKDAQRKYNASVRGRAVQKLRSSRWLSRVRGYAACIATPEEVLVSMTGICAGCRRRSESLVLDHCHKTGKLRGWLCNECNSILGFARDNRQTLLNLVEHLSCTHT